MKMTLRLKMTVFAVLVLVPAALVTGSSPAAASAAVAATPAIVLSLPGGPPTSSLTLSGTGFSPGEPVDLFAGTNLIGSATAGTTGTVRATAVTIPATTQPGSVPVVATGRRSHFTASTPFVVRSDWLQEGFSATAQSWNPFENTINRGNAGSLRQSWSTIGPAFSAPPVVAGGYVVWPQGSTVQGLPLAAGGLAPWSSDIPAGEVAVAGKVAYLTGSLGRITAVDLYGGTTRWTRTVPDSAAATLADGALYVPTPNGSLTKLDAATGSQIWTAPGPVGYGKVSVSGGLVFVAGPNQSLQARSAATGALRWSRTTGKVAYYSPLVVQGATIVARYDTGLVALDTATGQLRWTSTAGAFGRVAATPTTVFAQGSAGVVALNLATGAQRWSATGGNPQAVANGLVYVGTDILNADTGLLVGRLVVPRGGIQGVLVANGNVVVHTLERGDQGQYLQDFLFVYRTPPGPPSRVTIDDTVTGYAPNQITYSAGWKIGTNSGDFRGTDHYSSTAGNSASVTFTGTGFRLWFSTAAHHGIAHVVATRITPGTSTSVVLAADIDEYSLARHDGITSWTSSLLPLGTYKVVVTATGRKNSASTGTTTSLDRIDFGRAGGRDRCSLTGDDDACVR